MADTHHESLGDAMQAVRDELETIDGWSDTGIDDQYIQRRIKQRAYPLVDNELAADNPAWRLPILESLLAGHYILASGDDNSRQVSSESDSDGAQASYTGSFGEGLRSTTLGQQAIEQDASGRLADMADGAAGRVTGTVKRDSDRTARPVTPDSED